MIFIFDPINSVIRFFFDERRIYPIDFGQDAFIYNDAILAKYIDNGWIIL